MNCWQKYFFNSRVMLAANCNQNISFMFFCSYIQVASDYNVNGINVSYLELDSRATALLIFAKTIIWWLTGRSAHLNNSQRFAFSSPKKTLILCRQDERSSLCQKGQIGPRESFQSCIDINSQTFAKHKRPRALMRIMMQWKSRKSETSKRN